ncbi:MAG: CsgG/HfaB family protein [Spirochaetales bacterium]|nr:CsgG/HfaB family protein [Spirochaetales bacterium]
MRKATICLLSVFTAAVCTACLSAPQASGPARQLPQTNLSAAAGADESEIIIQRGPDNQREFVSVFIDGILKAEVSPNSSEKLILPNGPHSISVSAIGRTTSTQKFQAQSSRLVFKATITMGTFSTLILTKESDVSLDPSKAVPVAAAPAADSLSQAIALTASTIAGGLPEKCRVGVINITASRTGDGEFAADELTTHLVNMKKFSIVDRRSLDVVLAEQNLHMSGIVDDDSVISLGKLAGAEIVLTGSIGGSGENRRLTVKALDVQTGEIQAMSSQKF